MRQPSFADPFVKQDKSQLPIGVFDSGVGGLTVLGAMLKLMPGEDYLFLGDTARLPYGSKSRDTIVRYSLQTTAKLVALGIKLLVIACNTATSAALPALREAYPGMPIIGVVEPGALAACHASPTGHIAVIATPSTTKSGAYRNAILRHRPEANVRSLGCPLFVPLAEEGWFEGPIVESIASTYLAPLFGCTEATAGAETNTADDGAVTVPAVAPADIPDCLVLGCTHYPMLAKAIRKVIGPGPVIIDSAATTAETVQNRLNDSNMAHPLQQDRKGVIRFFTTDDPEKFALTGSRFLGMCIPESDVELVDL